MNEGFPFSSVSTHASVRRRLDCNHTVLEYIDVSTHASVRRRQEFATLTAPNAACFNSRLREEATRGAVHVILR